MKTVFTAARSAAVTSLGALSALHIFWAFGSAWPAPDRKTLADAIGGFDDVPGTRACLSVAALIGVAALCVAGLPRGPKRLTRFGSAATSFVFCLRGGIGLAAAMPNAKRSASFAALDRRVYSPLCITIGIIALAGTQRQ